jgi:hypothetical protein
VLANGAKAAPDITDVRRVELRTAIGGYSRQSNRCADRGFFGVVGHGAVPE